MKKQPGNILHEKRPRVRLKTVSLFFAAILGFFSVSLFHMNLAPLASRLLTAIFQTPISVSSASLDLPSTIQLRGISITNGASCVPVEFATLDLSPVEFIRSSTPISSMTLSGSNLYVKGSDDGSFAITGKSQACLLFKLLSITKPGKAQIISLKTHLSTPLLPGERLLKGDITFLRNNNGHSSVATYNTRTLLLNDDLILDGRGYICPDKGSGKIDLSLQTRDRKTLIATNTTGKAEARFRYDANLLLSTEDLTLKVTLNRGSVNLKPLHVKLPFLTELDILCEYATLSSSSSILVDKSLLRTGTTSFFYEGPIEPSKEYSGTLTLQQTSLSSFLKSIGKPQELPPLLAKSLIDGKFQIRGKTISAVKGEAKLVIPTNEINGIDPPTEVYTTISFDKSGLIMTNGMVNGIAICDSFNGRIDFDSMEAQLRIQQIYGKTEVLQSLFNNELLANLSGEITGSANLLVPLNEPHLTSGRIGLEWSNDKNHELFPLGEFTGIPLIVKSAATIFDFGPDSIKIREFMALGENFDAINVRGEYDLSKNTTVADFVVSGLCPNATGLEALTGSVSTNGTSDKIKFNLRCAGDNTVNCETNNDGTHTLTWKFEDIEATFTGLLSLNELLQRSPSQETAFQVSVNKGPYKFNGHTRIAAVNERIDFSLIDGEIESPLMKATLTGENNLSFDSGKFAIQRLNLKSSSGGTIELEGKVTVDSLETASMRLSDVLLAYDDMPALRVSGSLWIESVDDSKSSHKAHSALVLIPEDRNLGLKSVTLIANLTDDRLNIKRMKARTKEGYLSVKGNIPFNASINSRSMRLGSGKCNLSIISEKFNIGHLDTFFKNESVAKGFINGTVDVTGTTEHPRLSGKLQASEGAISLPARLGKIDKLEFSATFNDDKLLLNNLTGNWDNEIDFSNKKTIFANLSLSPNFQTDITSQNTSVNRDGLKIKDVNFSGNFSEEGLRGTIRAEQFIYKATGTSVGTESALKEYLISARPIIEPSFPLNISVEIPKALHIRNSSLDAEFGGSVTVEKLKDGHAFCRGSFGLLRGNFYLQGQRFKLSKGHLAFRRDPGLEVDGLELPLPLPDIYIKGESSFSGITASMSLLGNPLVKNGMRATLDSENTDHTEGDIFGLFTARKTSGQNIASPILNEIGYQLLSTPLEETLGKVLPFDTIRLGGSLSLNNDYTPTILMGKYLGDDLHVNIEGGVGSVDDFWQQFAVDFTPEGSNMKLSFAKDLSGIDAGNTTMAFDYSISF